MFLKILHVSLAILSGAGFALRGSIRLYTNRPLTRRCLRIAPHIVDTLLLLSAILLAIQTQQYPLVDSWLTAKVFGLVLYIMLGIAVMRARVTVNQRMYLFITTLICYAYIVSVAITRNPLPFW